MMAIVAADCWISFLASCKALQFFAMWGSASMLLQLTFVLFDVLSGELERCAARTHRSPPGFVHFIHHGNSHISRSPLMVCSLKSTVGGRTLDVY